MVRKFLQGVLFLLLLVMLVAIGYGAWVYRQTGTLPFALPGVSATPGGPTSTPTTTPTPTPTPVMRPAVIVTSNLPAGTLLTEDLLEETQRPSKTLPDDTATSISQVVGQLLRAPLQAGEAVRLSNVIPRGHVVGKGSTLAGMLRPGEVAIAYPINRLSSVGYALRAGDVVDMVVTFLFVDIDINFQSQLSNHVLVLSYDWETRTYAFRPAGTLGRAEKDNNLAVPVYVIPAEGQRPRMVAQLTVQNARVLYIGRGLGETPAPNTTPPPPDVVVLAVSPQDAVILNFFMARQAETSFVLRSARDANASPEPTTVPVTLDYIQKHFGIPLPPQRPYQLNVTPPTATPRP